jgi:hypothetical protein
MHGQPEDRFSLTRAALGNRVGCKEHVPAIINLRLAIPRQRRRIMLTPVHLDFWPNMLLECPYAPSPSAN